MVAVTAGSSPAPAAKGEDGKPDAILVLAWQKGLLWAKSAARRLAGWWILDFSYHTNAMYPQCAGWSRLPKVLPGRRSLLGYPWPCGAPRLVLPHLQCLGAHACQGMEQRVTESKEWRLSRRVCIASTRQGHARLVLGNQKGARPVEAQGLAKQGCISAAAVSAEESRCRIMISGRKEFTTADRTSAEKAHTGSASSWGSSRCCAACLEWNGTDQPVLSPCLLLRIQWGARGGEPTASRYL